MIVTLEEMKQYLRVDFDDDDFLIETLITSATRLCMDITRQDEDAFEEAKTQSQQSIMLWPISTSTVRKQTIML